MRLFLSLLFILAVLLFGLPVAIGALAGSVVGWVAGREYQRIAHSRSVYLGHP